MMNCYFVKRADGDYNETQKIKAQAGHALLAKQAFGACFRKCKIEDGRSFFVELKKLLNELSKAEYTQKPNGWNVTGGKFLTFEKMTAQQLFATWASVQQTIAKWIYNTLQAKTDLWLSILEQNLVFKANDVMAVTELLFDFLQVRPGYFMFDTERSMYEHENRLIEKLSASATKQEAK